jgi:tRNA(fMet)-specific endonuclease VapC
MSATAEVFMHGRSQAVRLPKEFRLPGTEAKVTRVGNAISKSDQGPQSRVPLDVILANGFEFAPFDAADAREAGSIRAALERAGRPISPYDILIAAQARRRGATLVTSKLREFERVPGLLVGDWAA